MINDSLFSIQGKMSAYFSFASFRSVSVHLLAITNRFLHIYDLMS